jgi:GTP cyclohydrolase IA
MKKTDKSGSETLSRMFDFPNGDLVVEKLGPSAPRISRAFGELFSGYGKRAEDVLNETVRVESYAGIVKVRNVHFYTFCEHHFLPFLGTADVAYEPKHIITGIGKLVRLVKDVHARRLQIQELMTRDIAQDLMRVLDAKGAYVATRAKHLCTCSRGPRDDDAWTEVAYGTGTLERYPGTSIFPPTDFGLPPP